MPNFYVVAIYPKKISERLRNPRNAGLAGGANAVGTSASFECGCFVRFSMAMDEEKRIAETKFRSNGCGFMIAAADTIAEDLSGRDLTGLHAIEEAEFAAAIESTLGPFPPERKQCTEVVLDAVRNALADYRAFLLDEFSGEKALICTCFGVAEETIDNFIEAHSPRSVDDVTAACRAGGGCGSCRMLIQQMIDARV